MSIKQPDYQLKLALDLPEEAESSALSAEDIRLRSEAARARLEGGELWPIDPAGKTTIPQWWEQYLTLIGGGWYWKVAVYMAWLAMPKPRWPASQDELARNVLGLTSDRQFSVWRARNPAIDAMVADLRYSMIFADLGEIIAAGVAVAKTHDYKGKGDREMIYKMAGLLSDKVEAEIFTRNGDLDLSKLTWEEKLRLAGLDNPEALLALKQKLIEQQRVAIEGEAEENDVIADSSDQS